MKVYLLECGVENSNYTTMHETYKDAYERGKELVLNMTTRTFNKSRIAQRDFKNDLAGFIKEHVHYNFSINAYEPHNGVKVFDCNYRDNFRFDDTCWRIEWIFDAFGNLTEILYDNFEFKPGDEADDAGTKFQVGDFVLIPVYNNSLSRFEDALWIVVGAPGKRPERGTWGNDYTVYDICGPAGHFHPHETEIKPFKGEVSPDSPLWFWRDWALGKVEKEAEINVDGKKMTLQDAIYNDEIAFHEGIGWREFLKRKTGGK